MHLKDFLRVLILLAVVITSSCKKDELLTDSSARLDFSEDTILFDTVFTSIGSTTQYLLVYNNNDQPINISSIALAKGASSYYRINVDGMPGYYFSDIKIRAKDSLWIFIEVTIDPTNNTTPFLVTDSILFNVNGNMQDVDLIAFGQDAHFIVPDKNFGGLPYSTLSNNLNQTFTFDSLKPYVIYGYLAIDSTQTLNINPGTKLYFFNNGGLWIYRDGSLNVNGTKDHPVIFRGTRLEQSYEDTPGQWDRIWINEGGICNINYAIIKNGFIGLQTEYLWGDADGFSEPTNLTVSNTIIKNMSGIGIYSKNFESNYTNCVIANCGVSCVALYCGNTDFTHCTIADYWKYGQRSGPSVLLADYFTHYNLTAQQNYEYLDSLHASFKNCVVYGNTEMEIEYDTDNNNAFADIWNNCIIKVDPAEIDISNIQHFINILNNQDPLFESYSDNDYHLQSGSPAINFGDPAFSTGIATDIDGNPRNVNNPDLGAYEKQ